jgi:hypothetical protein
VRSAEPAEPSSLVGTAVERLRYVGELFEHRPDPEGAERPLGALDEMRLQSARIGVASTVAVLFVLLLYALLPGHYPLSRAPFFTLIAIAIAGTIPIALLPWPSLTQRGLVLPILYTWSLFDIALVSLGIDLTGGSHSDLYLVYLLQCVFMANVSYPRRGRITLTVLTVGAYVAALGGAGWEHRARHPGPAGGHDPGHRRGRRPDLGAAHPAARVPGAGHGRARAPGQSVEPGGGPGPPARLARRGLHPRSGPSTPSPSSASRPPTCASSSTTAAVTGSCTPGASPTPTSTPSTAPIGAWWR